MASSFLYVSFSIGIFEYPHNVAAGIPSVISENKVEAVTPFMT